MRLKRKVICSVLFAMVMFGFPVVSQADYIPLIDQDTGVDSGWAISARSDSVGGALSAVEVYDVAGDQVVIGLDKIFDHEFTGGLGFPVMIEFIKTLDDSTSQIIIDDEHVTNATGTTWFDYHMHLMVGFSHPQAGFDPGSTPDGDQLEDVGYALNYGYAGLPIQLNFVNSGGGGVAPSPAANNEFTPGYADGRIVIVTDPAMQVGDSFGLKEVPSVPEPSTFALLGISALAARLRRRRR